jgi:hypothetical protein
MLGYAFILYTTNYANNWDITAILTLVIARNTLANMINIHYRSISTFQFIHINGCAYNPKQFEFVLIYKRI